MRQVQAHALVKLTVKILVHDTWGPDCPIAQVHEQAVKSAEGKIQQGLKNPLDFEIVDAKVSQIIVETER